MKRISLDDLEHALHPQDYQQLYEAVLHKIEQGEIKPVKASGKNGKKPVLYREYWLIEQARGEGMIRIIGAFMAEVAAE